MELIKMTVRGDGPLLMHADILANPLRKETREHRKLTAKQKKTEDDHMAIAYSEFVAGCYYDEKVGLHIPGRCFDACFFGGAKLRKLGRVWQRGVLVMDEMMALVHEGPKTPDALWKNVDFVDVRGVKIGGKKVMRYRPVFRDEWHGTLTVAYDPEVMDRDDVVRICEDAGRYIGLCDFRPRLGRFSVHIEK